MPCPAQLCLGAAQGLAGGRVPSDRGAGHAFTEPGILDQLIRATDRFAGKSAMTRERLYLFDTTLRDGAQTPASISRSRTRSPIAKLLDEFGIDYVEGGYPGANPTDTAFFAREAHGSTRSFIAFGMTKRAGRLGLQRSRPRGAPRGEVRRDLLRRQDLGLSRPRRARLHQRGEPRRDPRIGRGGARGRQGGAGRLRAFLRRLQGQSGLCAGLRQAAYDAGARWVVLCDTNGGTLPSEVRAHRRQGDRRRHPRRSARHPCP